MKHRWLPILVALVALTGWVTPGKAMAGNDDYKTVKILRTTNKAQTNQFVCEAFEFKHINPYNVINFLWAPVSREEGGIYSFANENADGGVAVVICPEYQLPSLREMARELDRPELNSAPGSKYIYYRMRHRSALDANFRDTVSFYLGSSGVIIPDAQTNSLQIFDAPTGSLATEAALIEELDQPLRQVEINVKLYEVTVNSDGTLGLDFEDWKNGPGKILGIFAANGETANLPNSRRTSVNQRASGYYLNYPSAFFDAMVGKGKVKQLADTRIVAVNGVVSQLSTGEQILYYDLHHSPATPYDREVESKLLNVQVDSYAFAPGANASPANASIEIAETGILLDIIPTIGSDSIALDMILKVVNMGGMDNTGRPTLNSRTIREDVTVANGEETIIGGLQRERKVQVTRKIPLLGSLPVIGYLFGGEITVNQKTVVVAVVTAESVDGNDNVMESDRSLAMKAMNEEEVVVLPSSEFCFEQGTSEYLF